MINSKILDPIQKSKKTSFMFMPLKPPVMMVLRRLVETIIPVIAFGFYSCLSYIFFVALNGPLFVRSVLWAWIIVLIIVFVPLIITYYILKKIGYYSKITLIIICVLYVVMLYGIIILSMIG
jgi:hypothetical protein